jgi:hypothetical protein
VDSKSTTIAAADSKGSGKADRTFDRADTVRRLLALLRGESRKEFRVAESAIAVLIFVCFN